VRAVSKGGHLTKRQVLDIYFQMYPTSARDSHILLERSIEEATNGSIVHVFFMVMQAVCEQHVGLKDLAEESMELARQAIAPYFDKYTNLMLSCGFALIAYYEAGCGRVKSARLYLQFVELYFKELEQEQLNCHQIALRNMLEVAPRWLQQNDNYLEVIMWSKLKSDPVHQITEVNPLNYVHKLTMFNTDTVIDDLKNTVSKDMLHIVGPIIVYAMRMGILIQVNKRRDIVEDCALAITQLTENEKFISVPSFIVSQVALAAKVHLQIVKSIERGERENPVLVKTHGKDMFGVDVVDYYDVLGKDLRALQLLASRFKKVELFHSDLMKDIEELRQRKLVWMMLQQDMEMPQAIDQFESSLDENWLEN